MLRMFEDAGNSFLEECVFLPRSLPVQGWLPAQGK